jgi:hypothetical protein
MEDMIELIIAGVLNVVGYKFVMTKTAFKYPMSYVFIIGFASMGLVALNVGFIEKSRLLLIGITVAAIIISLIYRFAKTVFIHNEKRLFYRKKENYENEMGYERIILAMIFIAAFVLQVLIILL